MMNRQIEFAKMASSVIKGNKIDRTVSEVEKQYTDAWNSFRGKLENSSTVDAWLNDDDGIERYYNINGKYTKALFDSSDFYRRTFLTAFEKYFPNSQSVAEFGCGVGRNLIYIHLHHPHLRLYGFELCKPGVELAKRAAKKFNLPIEYFQLDYLNWLPSDIKMPTLDVGFTIFSLEQIPDDNLQALNNIFSRVNLGTFHLEPVVENYPWNIKGILGKIYHNKVGYLKNFEKSACTVADRSNVIKKTFNTAHNPVMYPSLYVILHRPARTDA